VLRATKTHRTYRVAIDDTTVGRLLDHRLRADARAEANGLTLSDEAVVFWCRAIDDGGDAGGMEPDRYSGDTWRPTEHAQRPRRAEACRVRCGRNVSFGAVGPPA
jgi:hypothetical protein